MKYFLPLLFLLFSGVLFAQNYNPVEWSYESKQISKDEFELIFTAQIAEGWTVYSQYIDEGGPVPTSIWYDTEGVIETIGKAEESGHLKEGMDPIFEMEVAKFLADQPYSIVQKVKILDPTKKLEGYLTYMTCDDERCLPPTDIDFTFDFGDGGSFIETPSKAGSTSIAGSESRVKKKTTENTPVAWSISLDQNDTETYTIQYIADIHPGWTVYSQYVDEGGPVPTSIWYDTEGVVQTQGDAIEKGHKKEGHDAIFDMNVIKFLADEPFSIIQEVKVIDKTKTLKGYITFMTCNDKKCLPPSDIEFEVDFEKNQAVIVGDEVEADNSALASIDANNVIDQVRPKLKETVEEPMANCGGETKKSSNLFWMFIFGFIGGMFALLTPCVFPMIPLTVSFFTKDTKRKGWWNGTVYGLSIIVIYVTIGLLITILFGEEALNRLSTNWIANTAFFVIFILFAFSFFGFYEITLPSSWSSKSDRMADKGGLIGIFFMAFTLAIVSFSCTGPIIGTAIVQASSNQLGPFVVMLGFAIALALPFGLFAAFPAWLNTLPRSGGWMTNVKVILGFLELALAFKFLSVADMTNHWGILRYELFMGIWVLVAIAMALYGFGFIKFPHDSPIKKLSPRRWAFSLGALGFAAYLATGFMYKEETKSYNALPLLSGIAPPSTYNYLLAEPEVDPLIKAKYPSFGKCANDIDCFKDYYEGLAYAKEQGKPLLIDHTGHGCVNCRKTEEHIWVDEQVRNHLDQDFVLVSLYVDDDKKLEEILISKSRNKKMRNIGNKWADFQIVNFEQNSQPLYVMITPEEEVISGPRGYQEGIKDYLDYLDCGLSAYESLSSSN